MRSMRQCVAAQAIILLNDGIPYASTFDSVSFALVGIMQIRN